MRYIKFLKVVQKLIFYEVIPYKLRFLKLKTHTVSRVNKAVIKLESSSTAAQGVKCS